MARSLSSAFAAYGVSFSLGVIEDEVALTLVDDDRNMNATTPCICHDAVWADGVRSGQFRWRDVIAVDSHEKIRSQVPIPIKHEAANCGEISDPIHCPSCVETISATKRGVRANCGALRLRVDG